MAGMVERLEQRFAARTEARTDDFVLLLVTTMCAIGIMGFVDLGDTDSPGATVAGGVVTVLIGYTLILSLRVAAITPRVQVVAMLVAAVVLVLSFLGQVYAGILGDVTGLLWLGMIVAAPVLVLRRVLAQDAVTAQTILGAISVYLLIALSATFAFLAIDAWVSFFGEDEDSTAFMYFSLVTVSTLGYGDLAPEPQLARMASSSLAVLGQIYIAVIVARLVASYSGRAGFRPRRGQTTKDDTETDGGSP